MNYDACEWTPLLDNFPRETLIILELNWHWYMALYDVGHMSRLGSTVLWPIVADECGESHTRIVFPHSISVCVSVIPCTLYVSNQAVKVYPLWQCGTGCHARSISLTFSRTTRFASLNDSACAVSEKPCFAVLRDAFLMPCNLNVCSYHFWDFISTVTRTYSVPPVKPPVMPSPPLFFPPLGVCLPLPLIFSLLTFCVPLLCSLSAVFLALPFPSLHEFPNCLHFLFTPSFFLKLNWITFTRLFSSHSLLFWVNASSVSGVYIHADTRIEKGIRGDE